MNEIKIKKEEVCIETYEAPKCEITIMQNEGAILNGSGTGSASHGGFMEDDYQW